jgi:uncharacterized membrane protein HdeD (DUF308 family)
MSTSIIGGGVRDAVRLDMRRHIWAGAALVLIGIAAVVWPMLSTLVATYFVGCLLAAGGIVGLLSGIFIRGSGQSFAAVLYALLSLAAGGIMVARPELGMLVVTLTLGVLFMVQGAYELAFAFELRPAPGWTWMLLSGLASVIFSLVIISGWPASSLITLGVIIGVNFISSGLAFLTLGMAAARAAAN